MDPMNVVHIDEITTRRWTFAEYQAIDAVNWSSLKHMRRSPLHFKAALEENRDAGDTDQRRLGRVVHTAVFEPDRLTKETVVWEGERRAGKEWERFKELHHRKTIIRVDDAHRAIAIRDAVRGCPLAMPYLATGQAEQVLQWKDRRTGLQCKARLDWFNDAAILDLKTARNACHMRNFARDAFELGYFHQAAFYQRGLATVRGTAEGPPVLLVAVEPEPPHDVAVYRVSEDALHFVNEDIHKLLERVAECRASDRWPGTFADEQLLDMPKWGYPSAEDMTVPPPPAWLEGA
jgi:hypothetical protein